MSHKTAKFYYRDYVYLMGLAAATLTAHLTNNLKSPAMNEFCLWAAFGVWGFEMLRLSFKSRGHWIDMMRNLPKYWASSMGYFFLWFSFVPAPVINVLNGELTPMEGIWSFLLLNLSMQPLRYWCDRLKDEDDDGILRVISKDHSFSDMAA